ncbi:membrane-associated progesterone receptor component 2-like [Lingula anatina]|uniref:Membrane-associated progesterone receptor component 2-like n=1 Tax=Lingula anatina TaxID=7574 RepID=A0A1S3HYW2_LINAN|nr:membrane-associated progesterone receptor component 2-like [Lingula anatina]|eukprot:XP_013391212.1 membrane-associated progesterone receptor component 2-like [Lingula anatina]
MAASHLQKYCLSDDAGGPPNNGWTVHYGPYGLFAGRDASRGLATFSLDTENAIRDEYDDLSDLNSMQMDSIREWEMQFTEKYDYVGRLLKPGETPREYSDTEDETDKSKDA